MSSKNSGLPKNRMFQQTQGRFNEYTGNKIDEMIDDEDPFEYNRPSHFERSASFGFNQDTLGRLNEINRTQVQAVLKGTHYANFRRTNSNFHRPMFTKQKHILNDALSITKQKTPSIIHNNKQHNLVLNSPPKNTGSLSKLDSQKSSRNRSYLRTNDHHDASATKHMAK